MEGIKYVNLIEIGPVVIEIWGVENGDLAVPVNNMLVYRTSFLAADTWLCVSWFKEKLQSMNFKMTCYSTVCSIVDENSQISTNYQTKNHSEIFIKARQTLLP